MKRNRRCTWPQIRTRRRKVIVVGFVAASLVLAQGAGIGHMSIILAQSMSRELTGLVSTALPSSNVPAPTATAGIRN